jgi:hypothetical protein
MADVEGEADSGPEGLGPRARLMHEVAEQMDAIEGEFGDGFEIGRVITVVEIRKADGDVELRVRAGQYPWVAVGMLETAKRMVEGSADG